jgi:hypothetical protein
MKFIIKASYDDSVLWQMFFTVKLKEKSKADINDDGKQFVLTVCSSKNVSVFNQLLNFAA